MQKRCFRTLLVKFFVMCNAKKILVPSPRQSKISWSSLTSWLKNQEQYSEKTKNHFDERFSSLATKIKNFPGQNAPRFYTTDKNEQTYLIIIQL